MSPVTWPEGVSIEVVTFADSKSRWKRAARRLVLQARESQWFQSASAFDERWLSSAHPILMKSIAEHGFGRGFGFWRWKPALIVSAALASNSDFVVYLDAGCELNTTPSAQVRLSEYLEIAADQGICLMHQSQFLDGWCKTEALNEMSVSREDSHRIRMVVAGALIVRVRRRLTIIDSWLNSALTLDGLTFDDRWDQTKQQEGFKDHRHDQAVLSVLADRSAVQTIPDETYFSGSWIGVAERYPIWAMRNRYPFSLNPSSLSGASIEYARRIKRHLMKK